MNNSYYKKYLKYKNKYIEFKKIGGFKPIDYSVGLLSPGSTLYGTYLHDHAHELSLKVDKDGDNREPAMDSGILYVLNNHSLLDLDSPRKKYIIDGMNIIRNKYILLGFLAETLYYNDYITIQSEIYTIIKNPSTYSVSLDLIQKLIPLIIKFLKLTDTDIYLTYQSSSPEINILGKIEQEQLDINLFGNVVSSNKNNKIFLLGVSCWLDDGLPFRNNVELCHTKGKHNEADDIVCVFLYSLFDKLKAKKLVPELYIWSFDNYKWYTNDGYFLRDYIIKTEIKYDDFNFNEYNQTIIQQAIYPQSAIALVKNNSITKTSIEYSNANKNLVAGIEDYIKYLNDFLQISIPIDIKTILKA